MTKRVAIYARVSTKEQDCTRQLVELNEVAENHGWKIVDQYVDEGISGSKKSRPELDRMMKDAISRKFEMVATLELSRLGRSVKNMCEIVDLFKSKNIHLFVKNQNLDTSTTVGEFFFNIINSVAQYERDLISERVVSGLNNAKRKGKKLGRKTNLTPTIEQRIRQMKSENIGLKKIAAECAVGVKTVRSVLVG
jgi:DNA invertase Pin-like site-specific DNA recombinase